MAESLTEVSVRIGSSPKREYRDLKQYSIDSSVTNLADAFSVQIVNAAGVRPQEIALGAPVEIIARDVRVSGGREVPLLRGLVTDVSSTSDDKGGTIWDVSGYDLGWHLVNCCGPLFKTLNGLTFQKMMDAVLDPSWGFRTPSRLDNLANRRISQGRAAVAAAHTPVDVFIPPICFEAGDMIADKLITYARRARRLVNVSCDGYLQLFQPDYTTESVGTIHYHGPSEATRSLNNTKGSKVRRGIDGIFTDVVCVGTVVIPSVLPDKYNPHAGNFKGVYTDTSALPFRRLLSFSDGDVGVDGPGLKQATARAEWKAKRGLFDSWSAEYNLKDHVMGGTFFAPDTMISVDDTVNRVKGSYYIASRRFSRSASGGTMTQLQLRPPRLLSA